jgi:hypothetical protein
MLFLESFKFRWGLIALLYHCLFTGAISYFMTQPHQCSWTRLLQTIMIGCNTFWILIDLRMISTLDSTLASNVRKYGYEKMTMQLKIDFGLLMTTVVTHLLFMIGLLVAMVIRNEKCYDYLFWVSLTEMLIAVIVYGFLTVLMIAHESRKRYINVRANYEDVADKLIFNIEGDLNNIEYDDEML